MFQVPWQRLLFFVLLATAIPACGQSAEIDHWDLGLATSDADLSPDDSLLAVTSVSLPVAGEAGAQIIDSLEVWDYRRHKKVAGAKMAFSPVGVRFTADGSFLVVVAEPTRLHVLDAATLKSVRLIELPLSEHFRISVMETSPTGHVVIVAADNGNIYGALFAYDLDTGRQLLEWKPPGAVHSISWKPDGTQFATAAPYLCTSIGNEVDVFSAETWGHVQSLSAKNAHSLAFSHDRLYAVQTSLCKGSVFKRHLGMTAFDAHGWKREKTIFLPKNDIHGSVSFANGRLLADTGTVKTDYDWSDMVGYAFATDAQLTIWEGDAKSVIFTSAPLAIPKRPSETRLRLSRTGKMVLFNPQSPQVFKVP
jgi:hypothetical protein